ncbi:MAG: outer membrane protein assembly factor [Spirochaetia bacterium]
MAVMVRLTTILLLLTAAGAIFAQTDTVIDTSEIPIEFRGNEIFPNSALREAAKRELDSFTEPGGTPADLADAAYTIQAFYITEGFPEAKVTAALIDTDGDEERKITNIENWKQMDIAAFIIQEGSRYFLGKVTFPGAEVFDAEKLRSYIPTGGAGFLGAGKSLYRKEDIATGINRIQKAYILEGYLNVAVGPADAERNEEEKVYDVAIPVEEGKRYIIKQALLPENLSLDGEITEELRDSLPKKGNPFTYRAVAKSAAGMEKVLGKYGYYPGIDYSVMTDEENGNVEIRFLFDTEQPLRLGEIRIKPHKDETDLNTKEWFIRSIFPLKEGDVLDIREIQSGRNKLIESGLFSIASVDIVPEGENGLADLSVTLAETRHKFIELAAGFGTWEYLKGSAEYVDKNIFGLGRRWSIRGEGSFKAYRFSTRLDDRFLFGPDSLFSLQAAVGYARHPTYAGRNAEASFSLTYDLTDIIDINGGYLFRFNRTRDRTVTGWAEEAEEYRIGIVSIAGSFDGRDDFLLPKKGVYLETTAGLAAPFLGSALNFYTINFSGDYHLQFTPSFILTLETEYETKVPFGNTSDLPSSERLYSGGPVSVRSFRRAVIGPVSSPGIPAGGLSRAEGTAELRMRIWQNIWGAVFYDIGSIAEDPWSFAEPGHGVGGGLRYYFPIGPVRVDLAYNPGPLFAASNRWAFHITLGFSY